MDVKKRKYDRGISALMRCLFSLFILLLIAGCVHQSGKVSGEGFVFRDKVCDKLYFGLSYPGGIVTERQWEEFLDTQIVPRFPDGLTVYSADGRWKDGRGALVKEKTRVVEIIHADDPLVSRKLRDIVDEYKKEFRQESVYMVRSRVGELQ